VRGILQLPVVLVPCLGVLARDSTGKSRQLGQKPLGPFRLIREVFRPGGDILTPLVRIRNVLPIPLECGPVPHLLRFLTLHQIHLPDGAVDLDIRLEEEGDGGAERRLLVLEDRTTGFLEFKEIRKGWLR
jgi:hypothetical protein